MINLLFVVLIFCFRWKRFFCTFDMFLDIFKNYFIEHTPNFLLHLFQSRLNLCSVTLVWHNDRYETGVLDWEKGLQNICEAYIEKLRVLSDLIFIELTFNWTFLITWSAWQLQLYFYWTVRISIEKFAIFIEQFASNRNLKNIDQLWMYFRCGTCCDWRKINIEFIGVHSLLSLLDLEIQLKNWSTNLKLSVISVIYLDVNMFRMVSWWFFLLFVVIVVPLELKRCGYLTTDASRICWR